MVTLPEIRKTQMARRFTRNGATRPECWGAETTDGVWEFEREESSGTPWLIYHRPSLNDNSYRRPVMQVGTLRACQMAVARGWAEQALETCKREAR